MRSLDLVPMVSIERCSRFPLGIVAPYLKQLKFDIKYILRHTSYNMLIISDGCAVLLTTMTLRDSHCVQNGVLLAGPFLTSGKAENHSKVEDNLTFLQRNPAPEYG